MSIPLNHVRSFGMAADSAFGMEADSSFGMQRIGRSARGGISVRHAADSSFGMRRI